METMLRPMENKEVIHDSQGYFIIPDQSGGLLGENDSHNQQGKADQCHLPRLL